MKFCICGGGALGHVVSGIISSLGYKVNLLTNKPRLWDKRIKIVDCYGKQINGILNRISNKPGDVIPDADVIIICLPGFLIEQELLRIKGFIGNNAILGSIVASTGFFLMARSILSKEQNLRTFGFQRVPFICRIDKYGHSAHLLGYKNNLNAYFSQNSDANLFKESFEKIFKAKIELLNHPLEATLTNSNPILHTSRLYSLAQKSGTFLSKDMKFYEDWDIESSELLINCDAEFQLILNKLSLENRVPSILDYYDSYDADSLASKLRSITAFKGIGLPLVETNIGCILDVNSRYFIEDFPYGLLIIKCIAHYLKIDTPYIDIVLNWGQSILGKEYLLKDKPIGRNISELSFLQANILSSIIKTE